MPVDIFLDRMEQIVRMDSLFSNRRLRFKLRPWSFPAAVSLGVLTVLLALTPVAASAFEQRLDLLGDPVPGAVGRPVRIEPTTRSVTVEGGETIRFESNGKQFSWNFNGPLTVQSFNLRRVAPPGMLDHDVFVYIRPNPLYIGPS